MVEAHDLYASVSNKGLQLRSSPFSHHRRSLGVLWQAVIKECTSETLCSGGHTGAEAQFPQSLLEGFQESRQGSEGVELWPNATHIEQFMRKAKQFLSPSYYGIWYSLC